MGSEEVGKREKASRQCAKECQKRRRIGLLVYILAHPLVDASALRVSCAESVMPMGTSADCDGLVVRMGAAADGSLDGCTAKTCDGESAASVMECEGVARWVREGDGGGKTDAAPSVTPFSMFVLESVTGIRPAEEVASAPTVTEDELTSA